MYQYKIRAGIAMLELVFAIVIMGIVLMSAPMLVSQASKASLMGTQQEAIAAGATNFALILTRHWDENDTNESLESPILATTSNTALLKEVNITGLPTGLRVGMPLLSTRSFLTAIGTRLNASSIGADGNETNNSTIFDDIDDYDGDTQNLVNAEVTDTSTGDYVDNQLQFNTTVSYISDAPTSGNYNMDTLSLDNPFNTPSATSTSNIKMITITVTSNSGVAELRKNIRLRAFSCNIGTYSLAERKF